MPRPSGLPIIDEPMAALTVSVAHVEARGRLNILPRWRQRVEWLKNTTDDVVALMVFAEPGFVSIRAWEPDGPRIQQRFAEISSSSDADASKGLLLIQSRYQRLIIPSRDRPSLGDAALAHLGLQVERGAKSVIYVCVSSAEIQLISTAYRNELLFEGHSLIEDLP